MSERTLEDMTVDEIRAEMARLVERVQCLPAPTGPWYARVPAELVPTLERFRRGTQTAEDQVLIDALRDQLCGVQS